MSNEINLKITVDGKEAVATIKNTDEVVQGLYKSFRYGQQEVNGLTTSVARGFDNVRVIFQGVKETYSALSSAFKETIQKYEESDGIGEILECVLEGYPSGSIHGAEATHSPTRHDELYPEDLPEIARAITDFFQKKCN